MLQIFGEGGIIGSLKERIEKRLTEAQKNKEFKDVGRVQGSKKETAAIKIITISDLSLLENDSVLAFNKVKKDSVWPQFDWDNERNNGVSSGAAFLKKKLREAYASKPDDSASSRHIYVKVAQYLQEYLSNCKTIEDVKKAISNCDKLMAAFVEKGKQYVHDTPIDDVLNSEIPSYVLSYGKRKENKEILLLIFGKQFYNFCGRRTDSYFSSLKEAESFAAISPEQEQEYLVKLKAKRESIAANTKSRYEEIMAMDSDKFYKYVQLHFQRPPSRKEFDGGGMFTEQYYRNVFKRQYENATEEANGVLELPQSLKARDEDWSWAELKSKKKDVEAWVDNLAEELKLKINSKQQLLYIKRVGGYAIPEVSVKNLKEIFGFGAVNYGNYVKDSEAKEHTENAIKALIDLAEMLNMDVRQFNQIGNLKLGIGLKGRPGHLATYYSQTKDINLTKKNGDGSLAHEWGHYFDNVLCDGSEIRSSDMAFASHAEGKFIPNGLKPKTAQAFQNLMKFIRYGDSSIVNKVMVRLSVKNEKNYYIGRTDITIASANERISLNKDMPLSEVMEILDKNGFLRYPHKWSDTQEKILWWVSKTFNVMPIFQMELQGMSKYYYKSMLLGNSKYWTSNVELFARAFETFIYRKLHSFNRESTYLVELRYFTHKYGDDFYNNQMPYPSEREADIMDSLFENIILVVKDEYGISDFRPVINKRTDEYVELEAPKKENETDLDMDVEDEVEVKSDIPATDSAQETVNKVQDTDESESESEAKAKADAAKARIRILKLKKLKTNP